MIHILPLNRVICIHPPTLFHFILNSFTFGSLNLCSYTPHQVHFILYQKSIQLFELLGLVQPSIVSGTDYHVMLGCAGILDIFVFSPRPFWWSANGENLLNYSTLSSLLGPLVLDLTTWKGASLSSVAFSCVLTSFSFSFTGCSCCLSCLTFHTGGGSLLLLGCFGTGLTYRHSPCLCPHFIQAWHNCGSDSYLIA